MEIGHVFQLQQVYAKPMRVVFRDENDVEQFAWMGCYGIGTSRLLQAVVDQNHDEHGIVWPEDVAPYHVHIVMVRADDAAQRGVAEELHDEFLKRGVSVMLDDRDASAGLKFADADLMGSPWRVTAGRRAGERMVEVRRRDSGEVKEVSVEEAVKMVGGRQ